MDCYEFFGLDREATQDEIRKAWARKVREHHPEIDPEGYQRANECYQRIINGEEGFSEPYEADLEEAIRLYRSENYERSIVKFKRLLLLYPQLTAARLFLAYAYYESGQYGDAAAQLELVLEEEPDRSDALRLLAYSYHWADEVEEAARCYESYLKRNRSDVKAAISFSALLRDQGRFLNAVDVLDASLRDCSNTNEQMDLHKAKLSVLFANGDQVKAEWALEALVREARNSPRMAKPQILEMLRNLGRELHREETGRMAKAVIGACLAIESDDAEMRTLYGDCQKRVELRNEWERIKIDDEICTGVTEAVRHSLLRSLNIPPDLKDGEYDQFQIALRHERILIRNYVDQLRLLESKYPSLASISQEFISSERAMMKKLFGPASEDFGMRYPAHRLEPFSHELKCPDYWMIVLIVILLGLCFISSSAWLIIAGAVTSYILFNKIARDGVSRKYALSAGRLCLVYRLHGYAYDLSCAVWAYRKHIDHYTNFIKTSETNSLQVKWRHKTIEIPANSGDQEKFCQAVMSACPNAVLGHTEEIKSSMSKHRIY